MQEQANECKFAKLLAGARPKEHRFGPSKPLELDSQLELSLNQLVKPAEQIPQTGSPTSGAPGVRIPTPWTLGTGASWHTPRRWCAGASTPRSASCARPSLPPKRLVGEAVAQSEAGQVSSQTRNILRGDMKTRQVRGCPQLPCPFSIKDPIRRSEAQGLYWTGWSMLATGNLNLSELSEPFCLPEPG